MIEFAAWRLLCSSRPAVPLPVPILLWEGSGRGDVGAMMVCVNGETIDQLPTPPPTPPELTRVLTLVVASYPPGELSPDQMDALTVLSHKILTNIAEMRETLAQASDQLTNWQN
jgi:hypothetical protein